MADAEFNYDPCTCTGGMRDGLRCADCGGRGLVSKGVRPSGAAVPEEGADVVSDDELDQLAMVDLRAAAKAAGLSAGGSREAITARIRAASASDEASGETTDQDGDGTGDDASAGDDT